MNIEELKQAIDLDDLAVKLGLEKPKGSKNYKSPHHDDKHPSLSIFQEGKAFKDFSSQEKRSSGSCIDFIIYIEELADVGTAIKRLHQIYGFENDRPKQERSARVPKTRAEFIAAQSSRNAELCIEYLVNKRGISEEVIRACIKDGSLGFNDWHSKTIPSGNDGHGGPSVAFICRDDEDRIRAVDLRYVDPDINGGRKSGCQGDKLGVLWVPDRVRLKRAHTVYIVESAINALTVHTCTDSFTAAVAFRGVTNTDDINWRFLRDKKIRILVDNDDPDKFQHRPGPEAGWRIHEHLVAANLPCLFVNQAPGEKETEGWIDVNDINDYLMKFGKEETSIVLKKIEPWLIQNLVPNDERFYKRRVYLPGHDESMYWRYRVKEDFISMVKMSKDANGDDKLLFDDVAGFRIAALSRIRIASPTSMMTGVEDAQPTTLFAASVQTPRHENKLIRRVFTDESLHNIDQWKKFGPVFKAGLFARMLNILERGVSIGERDAVNFVGIAWKDGKAVVNEGQDCYFTDPDKQCSYHNLIFPSGPVSRAGEVIRSWQNTFGKNAATFLLVWSLGAHLKNFLGFWPHMILQANKGAGKTTLVKRLETTVAMTMLSGQSLNTEFRILTSLSCTSHPIGWEEISAREQKVIDKATSLLQEAYNYNLTRRGSDMLEYVISAPVLLAGEDVPVQSLSGKVVRSQLVVKGELIPDDAPSFPVRQWLEYLCSLPRQQVKDRYRKAEQYYLQMARASGSDADNNNGVRMAANYAAILFAWQLLCEFSGIDSSEGGFVDDCIREMNSHIEETSNDREPWIFIMGRIINDIEAGNYAFLSRVVEDAEDPDGACLYIRATQMIQHLQQPSNMQFYNSLSVKSANVLKKHLVAAGVVVNEEAETQIGNRRCTHMLKLSVDKLARWGLYVSLSSASPQQPDIFPAKGMSSQAN